MNLREVAQQALEAMEDVHRTGDTQVFDMYVEPIIHDLRKALAQHAASFEEWFTREGHDESDRFIAGLAWNAGMDCAVQFPLTDCIK